MPTVAAVSGRDVWARGEERDTAGGGGASSRAGQRSEVDSRCDEWTQGCGDQTRRAGTWLQLQGASDGRSPGGRTVVEAWRRAGDALTASAALFTCSLARSLPHALSLSAHPPILTGPSIHETGPPHSSTLNIRSAPGSNNKTPVPRRLLRPPCATDIDQEELQHQAEQVVVDHSS